ncbi:MAG: cytochrome b [Gammaproteobacteria bacterium]|nr:cytochrome b [Gammaproteobacteria bacterium]
MNYPTDRYDAVARALHWLMALMIFGLIGVGLYMGELPREDALRPQLYMLHKTFGVLTLILLVIRIAWKLMVGAPELPRSLQRWEINLAKATKFGMYLLMLVTPIAGYALSNFADKPIALFGVIEMPTLLAPDKELKEIAEELHEIFAFTLLGLVGLHVAGALKHRLFGTPETDVLRRIL